MIEKIARQKRRGFQRVSQSVVSQKKYFGETAKMKLFLLVTFLHLPNVCSSQHELCRKQIASIFCMNFDKEEIRACRKTVTLRIEGDEVCDVSGRCATVLLPCMKLLPPDTNTTTTTAEKAAPARSARRDPRGTRSS
jgi:hypothetical protein